jgi:hypothetical protein
MTGSRKWFCGFAVCMLWAISQAAESDPFASNIVITGRVGALPVKLEVGPKVLAKTNSPSICVTGKFGFYPVLVYEVAPEKSLFAADFYFWVSVPKDAEKPALEAANGTRLESEVVLYNPNTNALEDTYWYRFRSQFYHSFDFSLYPFDRQVLQVKIERPDKPLDDFRFELKRASHLVFDDPSTARHISGYPKVSGWEISSVRSLERTNTYHTDWGFTKPPDLSRYSQAILEIQMEHRWAVPLLALLCPNILIMLFGVLIAGAHKGDIASLQALLGLLGVAAAQHFAFINGAPGVAMLQFAQTYYYITYLGLTLCFWHVLTKTTPLSRPLVAIWFFLHLGVTLVVLMIQVERAFGLAWLHRLIMKAI